MLLKPEVEWLRLEQGRVRHFCLPPHPDALDIASTPESVLNEEWPGMHILLRSMTRHVALCGFRGYPQMKPFMHPTSYGKQVMADPAKFPFCRNCTKLLLAHVPTAEMRRAALALLDTRPATGPRGRRVARVPGGSKGVPSRSTRRLPA